MRHTLWPWSSPPASRSSRSGVSPRRTATRACSKRVDLEVDAGEVHALLGENGAGKSTLIKIVSGVVTPDEGSVAVDGQALHFGSPQAAMHAGVATLFQELSTVGGLSVAENVLLGRPTPSRFGVVRWGELNERARELFATLGQDIDVTQDAEGLSPVGKTMTALARALSQESKVLILDEPTAALTDAETSRLFAAIERLQQQGIAIVYVSHRLEEVFDIADRFTVLRNGRKVDEGELRDTSVEGVIAAMAGRPIEAVFPSWEANPGDVRLQAPALAGRRVRDASFELRAGEVLGVAGLAGSGRSELLRLLSGATRLRAGTLDARRLHLRAEQRGSRPVAGCGAGAPGAPLAGPHAR